MTIGGGKDDSRDDSRPAVLVVEDEALILMSVIDMVEELGYRGIGASDAAAALARIRNGVPLAAMIADISLPDMPGEALARAAREERRSLPIVFSTGHRMEVPPDLAGTGPTAVLGKPYWTEELGETLNRLVGAAGAFPSPADDL